MHSTYLKWALGFLLLGTYFVTWADSSPSRSPSPVPQTHHVDSSFPFATVEPGDRTAIRPASGVDFVGAFATPSTSTALASGEA